MAIALCPDETDDLLRLGLHRLPIGDFPLLRGLAPVLAAYDGAAELKRGLDILLTGLASTLPPDRARNAAGRAHTPRWTMSVRYGRGHGDPSCIPRAG
jgi:hypothetical protein